MASPPSEEIQRDLGFGSVVSTESHQRLLNRDGSFNVARHGLRFWSSLSLYHALLTMSWPRFLLTASAVYLALNLAFAGAYALCGPEAIEGTVAVLGDGAFPRGFLFSVETLSTVGYGHLVPASIPAVAVMTAESLVGLFSLALATGLIFARFSRPTAKIAYSRRAVVAPYRDGAGLMFRIVNLRKSQIIELQAKLTLVRVTQKHGHWKRTYDVLPLERQRVTFFPLAWTIVHPIDEKSPLWGLGDEDLQKSRAEFLVLLSGVDEVFSQIVHSRTSYTANDVVWNARFAPMFDHSSTTHAVGIDVALLDEVVPVAESSP